MSFDPFKVTLGLVTFGLMFAWILVWMGVIITVVCVVAHFIRMFW